MADVPPALLSPPAGYTPPLSAAAHDALDRMLNLEMTQAYNIQQCELCLLPGLDVYKQRSAQRVAMAQLIKRNFPAAGA